MTKLGQMLEDEKLQYAKEYAEENERQVAKRMLSDGVPLDTILRYSTLLSRQDIQQLLEASNA